MENLHAWVTTWSVDLGLASGGGGMLGMNRIRTELWAWFRRARRLSGLGHRRDTDLSVDAGRHSVP